VKCRIKFASRSKLSLHSANSNSFYDSAQADTAMQVFFTEGMRKLRNAGAGTGNWIVDDANLIEMILSEF
jgi:hypothetical protein